LSRCLSPRNFLFYSVDPRQLVTAQTQLKRHILASLGQIADSSHPMIPPPLHYITLHSRVRVETIPKCYVKMKSRSWGPSEDVSRELRRHRHRHRHRQGDKTGRCDRDTRIRQNSREGSEIRVLPSIQSHTPFLHTLPKPYVQIAPSPLRPFARCRVVPDLAVVWNGMAWRGDGTEHECTSATNEQKRKRTSTSPSRAYHKFLISPAEYWVRETRSRSRKLRSFWSGARS